MTTPSDIDATEEYHSNTVLEQNLGIKRKLNK